MNESTFGLPQDLGNGLLLRWGRPEDAAELSDYNVRMHSDDLENDPEIFLGQWTMDLMSGNHPTTQASDFTVVVDQNKGGKIVSSMNLISQTWAYDGIPFPCGRPELVSTDPDYRRQGLVRKQFEAIHAKSVSRGELVQGITGIPWYYRQFGYEMTLSLHGGRAFYWGKTGNTPSKPLEEKYRLRPAVQADLLLLLELYLGNFPPETAVWRVRDAAVGPYELFDSNRANPFSANAHIVETLDGTAVGYIEYNLWVNHNLFLREIAVLPGIPLREVALFATRELKKIADAHNETTDKKIHVLTCALGPEHPVYTALDTNLELPNRYPYAWYIRVPDLPAFLRHIAPALEKRLAQSPMAGYSGTLRLGLYTQHLNITWENGLLQEIAPYQAKSPDDADACFPNYTFYHVLFGHRSLAELRHIYPDCFTSTPDVTVLVNSLFPKRPSWVIPFG